ncbi:MAG: Ig-like domain-containing protein, partial [Gemmatimonadaceae bacterium]
MSHAILLFSLLVPQSAAPPQTGAPSPVARIVVTPAKPIVSTGDTLRLTAQALDANGQPVPNAVVRFTAQGARFEGTVDSLGLVTSGATGTIPVAVVALVPGARPMIKRIDVLMVSGPAAKIELSHPTVRLALGQRFRLGSRVLSSANDERPEDRVTWKSASPTIVRVDNDGMMTAVAAGKATVTAASGAISAPVIVEVVPAAIASLELTPSRQ